MNGLEFWQHFIVPMVFVVAVIASFFTVQNIGR